MSADQPHPAYTVPNKPSPEGLEAAPASPSTLDWSLLAIAMTAMVVAAAIDNLRAPLLPTLSERVGLSHSGIAAFIAGGSAGAFCLSLVSAKLLLVWPVRRFLAASCLLQIISAVLAVKAGSGWVLMVAGFIWGGGNAGLGLSANLFAIASTPDDVRSRTMSALHVCYGVAAMLPGIYVPWSLGLWRFEFVLLAPFALLIIPVIWAYARPRQVLPQEEKDGSAHGFGLDAALFVVGLSSYVLGEVIASVWLPTFLIDTGASLKTAGAAVTAFFAGLAGGRLAGVFLLRPSFERRVPVIAVTLGSIAFLGMLQGHLWAAALTGLCIAPTFPVMTSIMVSDYPKRYHKLLAYTFSGMMLVLASGHQFFGWLADQVGVQTAFYAPLACFATSVTCIFVREMRRTS
jgi:fucose permease